MITAPSTSHQEETPAAANTASLLQNPLKSGAPAMDNAAKDDNRSRGMGRNRVYSAGAGSMSIAFGFSDSESGEILGIVKDARRGSPAWGVNNSVTNMSDVRFMFGRWARMIRARLDIVHGY